MIHIRRSIVKQKIGPPKTEASQKPIPLGRGTGEQPLALEAGDPLQRSLRLGLCEPCEKRQTAVLAKFNLPRLHQARRARGTGLWKRIGWHTFRHTFGTILNANGENPKVIQELLRHANLRVTMDTYVQAVSNEKREAQSRVVRLLSPGLGKKLV